MNIQVEKRRDHAEAVTRLGDTRAHSPESAKVTLIAGWPALERQFVAPLQHPGQQERVKPYEVRETALHVVTSVAAGEFVIHFRTVVQPGAHQDLAEQAV